MKAPNPCLTLPATAALLALLVAAAPAPAGESRVKFSDPSQPGQLIIRLGLGDVVIHGDDTDEVVISSEASPETSEPGDNGYRRLDGGSGYSLEEKDNVVTVTLNNMMGGRHRDENDVEIHLPRNTRVTIERAGPGDVEIHDVTGDLELRGTVGDVQLTGVAGGVLVESVNGDVEAQFAQLVADRPVSITVVHGDVELQVPADAQANVRFRTLRGEMLTNFSETQLQTKFENANVGIGSSGGSADNARHRPSQAEIDRAQAEADRAIAEVDRAMAEVDRAQADIERAQAHAAADVAANVDVNVNVHGVSVRVPPIPPLPPMAGGKLVVGQLNGGGTDLIVTTLTGDITLHRQD
jgi:hypothetical protein